MESIKGLYGAALVTRDGQTTLTAVSDPSYEDARSQTASIGKQICAATLLMLADDGRLDLDEPVTRWYPASRWTFTVRQLLSHTSGLGHWRDAPGFGVFEPLDVDERIELFQQADLEHEPDRGWIYSSPGFVVLGDIARRATGQSYSDIVTARVLKPLGMAATTVGILPEDGLPGHIDGSPVPARPHLARLVGTGDIWSTPADIARFLTALHSGQLLPEASLRAMLSVRAPLTGRGVIEQHGYALGVYEGAIGGRRAYFHPGDNPGYVTLAGWLPDTRSAIVLLGNDETMNRDEVLIRLIPYATGV